MDYSIKPIEDFPNYLVDINGNIFPKNRLDKPLCAWKDNNGYLIVQLRKDKKKYYKRVHRIVAEAFIPNPNNLPQVNHKDEIKCHCWVDNLEWTTNKDNTQYTYNSGKYKSTYKVEVIAIHKITKEKLVFRSIRNMSEKLHLNRKTISAILNGAKSTNNYDYYFYYKYDYKGE